MQDQLKSGYIRLVQVLSGQDWLC